MAEARAEAMARPTPDHVGALFETGRNLPLMRDWWTKEPLVPVEDVLDEEGRDRWILENIRVFSDGTFPSPEVYWKPVVDFWLTELKVAAKNADLDPIERKETEKDLRAMFAVSASARAMEQTAGSAEKYVAFMSGAALRGGEIDLDVQDYWAEFLLHNDPDKLKRVLTHDLVRHYYERLINEAGINIHGKPEKPKKGETKEEKRAEWLARGTWSVDVKEGQARKSKLLGYLSKRNPYLTTDDESKKFRSDMEKKRKDWKKEGKKTSFDEYIGDVLLTDKNRKEMLAEGWSETNQWAAAKLACDAFLVDKYTEWEYDLDRRMLKIQESRGLKKEGLQLMPFPGWGGNPLRAILEPSFLPKRIKGMYKKEDRAILEMADLAFRPEDCFEQAEIEKELLPPSMIVHLKAYARWNSALWTFLGSSRGRAIPQWTEDTMYKDLPAIAEFLDQVYGNIDKPESNTGKHIVGAMMARIIQCKGLATAVESRRPGFGKKMRLLFGTEEEAKPFWKVLQNLWGPDYDASSGLLASFAGGRTRLVFKNNNYGAERTLLDAYNLLYTTDQDPKGRGKAQLYRTIRSAMAVAQAISKTAGGR